VNDRLGIEPDSGLDPLMVHQLVSAILPAILTAIVHVKEVAMRAGGILGAAVLAFGMGAHLVAQSTPHSAVVEQLDRVAAADDFNGVVSVSRAGQVVLAKGYGLADRQAGLPNTIRTRFRIASVTKPITATAVMLLEQRRALSLSARLDSFLEDLPAAWRPLTVHQLLTHTAGLIQPSPAERTPLANLLDQRPLIVALQFRDRPLVAAPGERYVYSALGYTLLAAVVEKVSGEPFDAFLRSQIFKPLKMNDTGPMGPDATASVAVGYVRNGDALQPTAPDFQFVGAGHLYSTIEDLQKWDEAMWRDMLLSRASIEKMLTPVKPDVGYGYGFNIARVENRPMHGHGGSVDGFTATLERYPDEELTIIALSNINRTPVHNIAIKLAEIVRGN